MNLSGFATWIDPVPLGYNGLQILGTHNGSGAASAKGPSLVLNNAGPPHQILTGRTDGNAM